MLILCMRTLENIDSLIIISCPWTCHIKYEPSSCWNWTIQGGGDQYHYGWHSDFLHHQIAMILNLLNIWVLDAYNKIFQLPGSYQRWKLIENVNTFHQGKSQSISYVLCDCNYPDSKVHGANMGPIWDRQDPGGPHVGPMNFAIWVQSI